MDKKRIICWGDSITVGMGMKPQNTYPAVLERLLGEEYEVINAGGGGETAYTIGARQGAYNIKTTKKIVFELGESQADITVDRFKMAFGLKNGELLNVSMHPNPFAPYEYESDLVYIDGEEYHLPKNGTNYPLTRDDNSKKKIIPKGAKVEFLSAIEQGKGCYCEIYYIGTNGRVSGKPTAEDINLLIEQYKNMIKRHNSDCFLVVIPYWNEHYTSAFVKEFGNKTVDFRKETVERGIAESGLTATEEDKEKMNLGIIPPTLRYKNNPADIHLNEYGYSFMAKLLYNRGKELGYW